MGHSIEFFSYRKDVNKDEVQKELSDYVRKETWREGGGGIRTIQWKTHEPFETQQDAEEYISQLYVGDYQQVAVLFHDRPDQMPVYYNVAQVRLKEARDKLFKLERKNYLETLASEYVTCKACGSRINREKAVHMFHRNNACPVCLQDTRPASTLKTVEKARAKVDECEKKLREAERKANEHGPVKWLVKIEYHI